jgi:anti-anti-sigma factor
MADTIQVEVTSPGTYLVVVDGSISFSSNRDFQAALETVLSHQPDKLVIDLSSVHFCNSQGFGDLLRAYTRQAKNGKTFCLIAPTPEIRKILEITKFLSIIEVYPNREAALI